MKHRKKHMSEFKVQWEITLKAKKEMSKTSDASFSRDFVNIIRFYLRTKSKKHIRNVVYLGIMDWEVLILFGKLINHKVELPRGLEGNEVIAKILSLNLEPITEFKEN